jgi:hypothetical protein
MRSTLRAVISYRAFFFLLQAFVYDPLVDWTLERSNDESKSVELHVSLSLFASRVDEMKVGVGFRV